MKILIHTDEYYPTAQACAYRMQVFADTFVSLGDEVTVLTSAANKANGKRETSARKEKIIYSPAIRLKKKTTLMRLLNNLSFGITSVLWAIGAGKADVVITTSPPPLVSIPGWIIAKCKGAKLIYDVRDIWPDVAVEMGSFSENSIYFKVFGAITRFMYKHADAVTTVSPGKVEKIKDRVASLSGKNSGAAKTDKVWLVGNGFDESAAQSEYDSEVVHRYGLDSRSACVYIGNIGLAQGLEVLLDIAANTKHRDVQFLCFGMGAEEERLKKRAEDEGLSNVSFCGVIEHSKVYSILKNAKISFIPLKNGNMRDSVPTKLYEAMGLGCPVLLAAEGDAAAIVDEVGLGRHVSPGNSEEMTKVFDEMLEHMAEFDAKKDEAIRIICERYSRQRIAEGLDRKLHCLCEEAADEACTVL